MLILVSAVVLLLFSGLLGALHLLKYIAEGESDVNGDPERDAGRLPPRREKPQKDSP